MPVVKNIIIPGSDNLPISLDVFPGSAAGKKPVVLYTHGFNGFKDWANFDLIASQFATAGYTMVKFNFSHNGTTPQQPEEFTNLQAFGKNNYSKQLHDLQQVVDWICHDENDHQNVLDTENIYLIGHSMGGGIAILYAALNASIKKLVTWAAISECKTPWGSWPPEKLEEWKAKGVAYYSNSRTNQQMPLYYQLYEDYEKNKDKLNIAKAIGSLQIPILICHGSADTAVPVEKAYHLKSCQPNAHLFVINSDHVFGRKHPWTETSLPAAMQAVVDASIQFLKS